MYGYSYGYASAGQQADSTLSEFELRVSEDGGTDASPVHTGDVINDIRDLDLFNANDLLLLCGCSAGKEGVLYSIYAFQDFNDFLAQGTPADTDYALETTQDLQRLQVYSLASLINPCVNGDADILYTLKP
jgi:hypothetical protein